MSVHTLVRPVGAAADLEKLSMLVAEPEAPLADPPLAVPNAAGLLLLAGLLALSSGTPKDPRK
jgi:hypothetical protein